MSDKPYDKMTKAELLTFVKSLDQDGSVTEFPEPKNVFEAINQLMGRVGYVQKTASQGLPYTFASEPEFIRAIRPHMVDLGLTIRLVGIEHVETIQYLTAKGAQAFNRVFLFTWEWTHAPSGTSCLSTSVGEGTDYGDKSCNKAMTVGLKYNMRQSLVIETGDDPDQIGSDEFVASDKSKAKPSTNGVRVENQWENKIIEQIIELGLYDNRPHVVNVLNHSPFMSVPYGDLTSPEAIAYVIMWQIAKEKSPDLDSDARGEQVNKAWAKEETRQKYIDQAFEMLGRVDVPFDSGLVDGDF